MIKVVCGSTWFCEKFLVSFQVLHCRELVALLNGIFDFRCIILLTCVPQDSMCWSGIVAFLGVFSLFFRLKCFKMSCDM